MPSDGTRRRRLFASSDAGFTIIEVLVSALILAILATAAATQFIGSTHAAATAKARSDAQALAQQNQATLRGLTVDQLSNLNQTLPAVTLNGRQFTVTESADYVTDSTGTPSCTNPSADYIQTTSTVTWANMGGQPPVTVTSVLTPPIGSIDPTNGSLAVSVQNAAGAGAAGMNIGITGPSSASETTATGGCALFGDLPAGTYGVSVTPSVGTYVDGQTGQTVTPTSPDVASPPPTVVAGTKALSPTPFQLDTGGTINFTFTNAYPSGVNPSPAKAANAPAVVVFNTSMRSPSYRLCAGGDTTCPQVGNPDTVFQSTAWTMAKTATPLFPYTYSTYAGMCLSDKPSLFGGTDPSANVAAGGTTNATLTLPSMVVRLYKGTTTSSGEETLPSGAHLTVTDTGCGVKYIGYTATAPTVAAGQSVLPLTTTLGTGVNDTGLLTYPGMPYGNYTVCYDTGLSRKLATPVSVTNQGSGEILNVFAGNATASGSC